MHPLALIILGILTPFLLLATLFVPPYAGMYGACFIMYDTVKGDPLATKYLDVFYVIDVYSHLFDYWSSHKSDVSFLHYTLPVIVLPLGGLLFGLWLTRRIARRLKNVFHLSVSIH